MFRLIDAKRSTKKVGPAKVADPTDENADADLCDQSDQPVTALVASRRKKSAGRY
jgi:hypothetical protein